MSALKRTVFWVALSVVSFVTGLALSMVEWQDASSAVTRIEETGRAGPDNPADRPVVVYTKDCK